MKARVLKPQPTVIVFGMSEGKSMQLSHLADRFRITTRAVSEDEQFQSVGFLLGWNGFLKNKIKGSEKTDAECIVFAGIDRDTLNRFLSAMREGGISVDLKAIVTPSNQSWRLCDLIAELEKERRQLGR